MRLYFYDLVPKIAENPKPERFTDEAIEADMYTSLWYGELYVVIEGYQELKLSDPTIDALLASPNVALLKRYRHGAFSIFRKTILTTASLRSCAELFPRSS